MKHGKLGLDCKVCSKIYPIGMFLKTNLIELSLAVKLDNIDRIICNIFKSQPAS
jgi:hypothetical protein